MTLNKTEKEQRVIELYQQGKTIREIAREVHMSFGNIGSIIRKGNRTEEDDNKPKEQQDKLPLTTLSKDSQAFKLFSEGPGHHHRLPNCKSCYPKVPKSFRIWFRFG
jgi:hypothetical protein